MTMPPVQAMVRSPSRPSCANEFSEFIYNACNMSGFSVKKNIVRKPACFNFEACRYRVHCPLATVTGSMSCP